MISGFVLGNKEKKNRKELNEFIKSKRVISVNIDNNTSEYFAQIFKELRKKGNPIPTNDMWICAIARQYNFAIFSYDAHFNNVGGITIIRTANNLKE